MVSYAGIMDTPTVVMLYELICVFPWILAFATMTMLQDISLLMIKTDGRFDFFVGIRHYRWLFIV
jgi:hypothetical protein